MNASKEKHPKELFILSICGITMRFAYWGVGNLLVLYLIQYYKFSIASSAYIYGVFTGVGALLPLIGGIIADRWNYHMPLFIGTIAASLGCFMISFGNIYLLLAALGIISLGYGVFIPSIFAILSHTYKNKQALREAGFTIYYASFNIGVFLAMIILGFIANRISWGLAFFTAGLVELIGIIPVYIYYKKYHLYYEGLHPKDHHCSKETLPQLKPFEKDRITVILILVFFSIFFWAAYSQGWSSMAVFTMKYTDLKIMNFVIPEAWILSLEALFLIFLAPAMSKLYHYLQEKNKDPSPPAKMAISLFFMALSFTIMMVGSRHIPFHATSAKVSPFYLISAFFVMGISEMFLGPISLSLTTRLSPKRYIGILVGLVYLSTGFAYYIGGIIAGLFNKMPSLFDFFAIFMIFSLISCILLAFLAKKLNKMRHMDIF